MEKRRFRRIFTGFNAEFISGNKSYAGTISDLSENGVGVYVKTTPVENAIDCTPGTTLQLKFQPIPGETLCLDCTVKWLHTKKSPPHGLTNSIGMEIVDPPWDQSKYFL